MKYLLSVLISSTLVLTQSCKTSSSCFKEQTVVFNADIKILSKYVCQLEERFSPSADDIRIAETAICNADSIVQEYFYKKELKSYRRQYLGFKNMNGEKIIIANLQHKRLFKSRKGDSFLYFQTEFNQGFGEEFEKYQRILSINLYNGKVSFPCNK
jgi:hypothetical protein